MEFLLLPIPAMFLYILKLKTDLNIAKHNLKEWRDLAIKHNNRLRKVGIF